MFTLLTLPPYRIRTVSAASLPNRRNTHTLIYPAASSASSAEAACPAPIAQTGS